MKLQEILTEGFYDVRSQKRLDFPVFIEDEMGNVFFFLGKTHQKGAQYETQRDEGGSDHDVYFRTPQEIEKQGYKVHVPKTEAEWDELEDRSHQKFKSYEGPSED